MPESRTADILYDKYVTHRRDKKSHASFTIIIAVSAGERIFVSPERTRGELCDNSDARVSRGSLSIFKQN